MLPVILLKGVEPVTPAKPVGGNRADPLRLLPQLDPGDILSARVEAKLPDGSYKVMVAGQPLRMTLPSYIAPGDTLELAFVSRDPRLTFVLKNLQQAAAPTVLPAAGRPAAAAMPQAGAPAAASNPVAADMLEAAVLTHEPRLAVAPKHPPQAAQAQAQASAPVWSAAGRLVAATMLQPGEIALPLAASATAPLLAAPPADGAGLALALARTLATSGLFYESHQAEWVAGKLDLARLRQEPQARLTQGAPRPDARAAAAELPAAAGAAREQRTGEQQTIHPRTVPLVQQQLAALDTARVVLQLEVWPRQWIEWEIEEHPSGAEREADAPQSWNTQLRLQLPQLGELKAALSLGPDGVRIRLEAASAASAALLQDQRGSLQAALAAAGVPPAGIAVARHEPA